MLFSKHRNFSKKIPELSNCYQIISTPALTCIASNVLISTPIKWTKFYMVMSLEKFLNDLNSDEVTIKITFFAYTNHL